MQNKKLFFLTLCIFLTLISSSYSFENLQLETTELLISYIDKALTEDLTGLEGQLGNVLDKHTLLLLAEEHAQQMTLMGVVGEAARLLKYISPLYSAIGDFEGSKFAWARHLLFKGEFSQAKDAFLHFTGNSELASQASQLAAFAEMAEKERIFNEKIMPAVHSLSLMQIRALEKIQFIKHHNTDTIIIPEGLVSYFDELIIKLEESVTTGIQEMILALKEGRAKDIAEAFQNFESYTSIDNSLGLKEIKEVPWYIITNHFIISKGWNLGDGFNALSGSDFKSFLNALDADVDKLINISAITDDNERLSALYNYAKDLRSERLRLGDYPAFTINNILDFLIASNHSNIKHNAKLLKAKVAGERSLTGFSDAELSVLIREGTKAAIPMTLGMLAGGPAGARVGAYTISALTKSATVASLGITTSEISFAASTLAFTTKVGVFWFVNGALHNMFIGGENALTTKALIQATLFLGGLEAIMHIWTYFTAPIMALALEQAPSAKLIYGIANKTGQTAVELSGFVLLGKFMELLNLAPKADLTFRQEIFQAAIILTQLKLAYAAAGPLAQTKLEVTILNNRLESAVNLLGYGLRTGKISPEACQRGLAEIFAIRAYFAELADLAQGGQLAFATAQASGFSSSDNGPRQDARPVEMASGNGNNPGKTPPTGDGQIEVTARSGRTPITAFARSHPHYAEIRSCIDIVVTAVTASLRMDRTHIRDGIEMAMRSKGREMPEGFENALNSLIDIAHTAKNAAIVGETGGKLSDQKLTDLLTTLYFSNIEGIGIKGYDVSHVPIVVEATLYLLNHFTNGKANVSQKKSAFVAAIAHDLAKPDLEIRTTKGYTIFQSPVFNKSGQDIEVRKFESIDEAIARQGIDPATVPIIATENSRKLIAVFVHHDALNTRNFIFELRELGIITDAEAQVAWQAVQKHWAVSSFVIKASYGFFGIRSKTLDGYEEYIETYRVLYEQIEAGKGNVTPEDLDYASLRTTFERTFNDVEKSLLLGDHQGQFDIQKYMEILPKSDGLSIWSLLTGEGMVNPMQNSIRGVILTHGFEQLLLSKAAERSRGRQFAMDWLEGDGLLAALEYNRHYIMWKANNPHTSDKSVEAFLRETTTNSSKFDDIAKAIGDAYYADRAASIPSDETSTFF
ncbi:MAG: hypothetical protein ABIA04_00860 [Pseudomonadota bacterium]